MIKEELKNSEPVVYQTLHNSLLTNRLAHAYLFSGEYNPLKIETAYLLAQSIIEDNNDFACETCDTCVRIRNNNYFDVIYIDGYKESIKKDNIELVLDEFSRTSLEKSNKKVYILANINNSSNKVLNMILKFMEDPSNENTFGIFITDNIEDLLPTIVSRCQNVPFITRDFSFVISKYENKGFEYIDAYLLANILHKYDDEFDLNDEYYISAKEYVYKTIDNLDNKNYLPMLFFNEIYPCFSDREDMRLFTDYYLRIFNIMLEDTISCKNIDDNEYKKYCDILKKYNVTKLLEIIMNAYDKTKLNAERKLLFDSIAYEIISYI